MFNKNNLNLKKGFTLIELLVVIAIIAILAAVVFASLGNVRPQAKNARIKIQMDSIRNQANLYYNNTGETYGTGSGCTATNSMFDGSASSVSKLITAIKNDIPNTGPQMECAAAGEAFYVITPLIADGGTDKFWCVDSNGYSGGFASKANIPTSAGLCK